MSGYITLDAAALAKCAALGTEALIDQAAEKVLGNMKRIVPTDTTALQQSLGTDARGEGADRRVKVGVSATFTLVTKHGEKKPDDYWEHVERGTSKAPAQPFLEPALAQSQVAK